MVKPVVRADRPTFVSVVVNVVLVLTVCMPKLNEAGVN